LRFQRTDIPNQAASFVQTFLRQRDRRVLLPVDLMRAQEVGLSIVRPGGAGDVLMTTPALRQLQRQYPGLRVTYYTSPRSAEVLRGNPNVHEVRDFGELDHTAPGVLADLRHYPERHPQCCQTPRARLFAEALGLRLSSLHLDYYIEREELVDAQRSLSSLRRPLIGVCAESSSAERRWAAAADAVAPLQERGSVVWIGDNAPPAVDAVMDGRSALRKCAAAIAACDVVISADSSPLHLCAALKAGGLPIKLLALMGVSSAALRLPDCPGPLLALEPKDLTCSPCEYRYQVAGCGARCQTAHRVDRVVRGVDFLLKTRGVTLNEVLDG
jgi:ADP-heptose:LPS heptosyltransferase